MLLFLIALVAGLALRTAAIPRDAECDLKAACVVEMLPFITFTEAAPAETEQVLSIAVLGDEPFGARRGWALDSMASEARSVRITQVSSVEQIRESGQTFDAVFIALSGAARVRQALNHFSESGTLPIGESDRFCEQGGMVCLRKASNRIQLGINQKAAERAGLKISSKLLALVTVVDTEQSGRNES